MSSPAFAAKSPDAFRTISEVAQELDVPQHVLRFWESRFAQIKPVKRAGGRRYYRPEDVDLLRGIRALLYSEGLTIRGVQKVLKDRGARPVAQMGRGEGTSLYAAPQVVEKLVFVEQPAAAAPKKKTPHLRAVPDTMPLPFFDEPAEDPAIAEAARAQAAMAAEEKAKLKALLAELTGLKKKLIAARR